VCASGMQRSCCFEKRNGSLNLCWRLLHAWNHERGGNSDGFIGRSEFRIFCHLLNVRFKGVYLEGPKPYHFLFSDKFYFENLDILTFMNLIAKLTDESRHSRSLAPLAFITIVIRYIVIEVSFLQNSSKHLEYYSSQ
jgi:hypothetical protein